ncbi:hypothetical protein SLS53_000630 [Cytospora paraplurivora]|uniref:Uncharacterized protein n=1 Tax=Cytospora paraplurivora TaxID=2898453 RepID=A0AAN9YN99_9PEZI
MLSRYLDQRFWATEVRRYGHQALRISRHQWQGRSLRSNASHLFFSRRDVERAFRSRTVFMWMEHAKWILRKAREYALADYMRTLTEGLVDSHMMRRRLHYEKKTWRGIDTNLKRLRDALTHTEGLITTVLEEYKGRRDSLPLGAAEVERSLEQYLAHIQDLFTRASEINRLLGGEVYHLQFLVLGVLRQEDEGRRRLQRYVDTIAARIQQVLRPAADHIIRIATDVGAECTIVVTEHTESCTAREVRVDPAVTARWTENIVPAMFQDANANFPSVRQHLDDLTNTIQSAGRAPRVALAESPLSRGFNLLVEEAGLREIRTERRRLRNLALRDMRRISNNRGLRRIIEQWLTFLESQDLQSGAATAEERQAIRHNAIAALAPLPAVLPGDVVEGSSDAS